MSLEPANPPRRRGRRASADLFAPPALAMAGEGREFKGRLFLNLVAEWIHFTLIGIILPTKKLKG